MSIQFMGTRALIETPACMVCGETSSVLVPIEGWSRWFFDRVLIQDALPDLTVEQRELLKTGMHEQCWHETFADFDDEGPA